MSPVGHEALGMETMDRTLERSTMRKVYLRLLPFAILSYVLAYIDRINVSFAGLTMRGDLVMSAGRGSYRRADLDGAARPRWPVRSAGLASHVHRRSDPDRGDRGDHVFRAHGSASGSKIPHRGGTQLARQHDCRRTPRHREGAHIHAVAGALQSAGAAAGVEPYPERHRHPPHADFRSANDQVAG